MSTRYEIRAALAQHGPLTSSELAAHCPACEHDKQIVGRNIAELRTEGKLRAVGLHEGEPVYDIGIWPAANEERLRVAGSSIEKKASTPQATAPAAPEESPMKAHKPLTERIGDALAKHGRCSLDELAKHVGTTKATLYTMMGKLKDEGIVRPVAGERGVYEAAKGAARTIEAPPAQAKKKVKKARRQKTGKKPAKRPRAVIPAEPPAPLNGEGAHFAIDEQGKLGIETREAKIALEPAEFERLRGFIERTKPVWQQDRG